MNIASLTSLFVTGMYSMSLQLGVRLIGGSFVWKGGQVGEQVCVEDFTFLCMCDGWWGVVVWMDGWSHKCFLPFGPVSDLPNVLCIHL